MPGTFGNAAIAVTTPLLQSGNFLQTQGANGFLVGGWHAGAADTPRDEHHPETQFSNFDDARPPDARANASRQKNEQIGTLVKMLADQDLQLETSQNAMNASQVHRADNAETQEIDSLLKSLEYYKVIAREQEQQIRKIQDQLLATQRSQGTLHQTGEFTVDQMADGELEGLRRENEEQREELETQRRQIHEMRGSFERELEESQRLMEKLVKQMERLKAEKKEFQDALQATQQKGGKSDQELAALQDEAARARERAESFISEASKRLLEIQSGQASGEQALSQMARKVYDLGETLLADQDERAQQAKAEVEGVRRELSALKRRNGELEAAASRKEEELSALRKEGEVEAEESRSAIQRLQAALQQVEEEKKAAEQKVKALGQSLREAERKTAMIDELQNRLEELEKARAEEQRQMETQAMQTVKHQTGEECRQQKDSQNENLDSPGQFSVEMVRPRMQMREIPVQRVSLNSPQKGAASGNNSLLLTGENGLPGLQEEDFISVVQLHAENEHLEAENRDLAGKCEALLAELQACRTRCKQLDRMIADTKDTSEMQKAMQIIDSNLRQYLQNTDAQEKLLARLRKEISQLQSAASNAAPKENAAETKRLQELAAMQKETIRKLEAQLEEKDAQKIELAELQAAMQETTRCVDAVMTKNEVLEAENARLLSSAKQLPSDAVPETEIDVLRHITQTQYDELQEAREQTRELQEKVLRQQNQIVTQAEQIAFYEQRLGDKNQQLLAVERQATVVLSTAQQEATARERDANTKTREQLGKLMTPQQQLAICPAEEPAEALDAQKKLIQQIKAELEKASLQSRMDAALHPRKTRQK